MDNKKYGLAEEYIKKNLPKSIEDVYKKSEVEFKKAIPSAIEHTVSMLDTDVINQQIIQNALNNGMNQDNNSIDQNPFVPSSQGNTNEKVRVRKMDNPSPFAASLSSTSSEQTANNYNYNYSNSGSYEEDQSVWKNSGFTETMILIGTGVLVLLVFMVSYMMLNYFG